MTFQEIFKRDGLYAASGFARGFCFEISNGSLYGLQYKNANDLMPERQVFCVYGGLFAKEYQQILTVKVLFQDITF